MWDNNNINLFQFRGYISRKKYKGVNILRQKTYIQPHTTGWTFQWEIFQRSLGPLSLHWSINSNVSTHANVHVHVHALLCMHIRREPNDKNIAIDNDEISWCYLTVSQLYY